MRVRALIFAFACLTLSACGNSGNDSYETENTDVSGTAGTTGYRKGVVPYITNGDPRVEDALRQEREVIPSTPQQKQGKVVEPSQAPKPAAPTGSELRVRVKEFQITRFKLNEHKPSRFGEHRYSIIVFFKNEPQAEFTGTFDKTKDGKLKIKSAAGKYALSGTFTDDVPLRVEGDLDLVDTKTNDVAKIFYSAYKAKLTVHEDREKQITAGSSFEKQLQTLRDHTFGWVHNWLVVRGPAFYLVDIVKQVEEAKDFTFTPPVMAFKGESLATGDEDHPAESLTPKFSKDISLVGNSETSRRRWFQTKFEDPDSKEENDVILDFRAEKAPNTGSGSGTGGQAQTDEDNGDDDEEETTTEPPATPDKPSQPTSPPAQPKLQPPVQPPPAQRPPANPPSPIQPKPILQPVPSPPLISGEAYLKIDISLPRTNRMTRDFARNRKISGVVKWINTYASARTWQHRDLQAFFKNAFPFRELIETIGRAYDVSPSYAYLTVIESPYFTGNKYHVSTYNAESSAVGPFQLLVGTAKEQGMSVGGGGNDERRFFAPSACGAARYIVKLVREFENSDSTVAILGYYQGDGGAARAIVCTYSDKSQCYGKNWSRYKQLARNYKFTYAQIANVAAIPKDQLDYVNRKLAIYFIAENIGQHGFSTVGMQSLPNNGSVFPPRTITDPVCRQTVDTFKSKMTGT